MIHNEIEDPGTLQLQWDNNCGYIIKVTVGDQAEITIQNGRSSTKGSTTVTPETATNVKIVVERPASLGGAVSKSGDLTWTVDASGEYTITSSANQSGTYLPSGGISVTFQSKTDGIVILGTVDLPVDPPN